MKLGMKATAAVLLLLGACHAARTMEGPARLGEIAYVDGPRVRADEVLEDSRCPTDVRCVWAGRLVVRATVFGGGWTKQVDLTLGEPVQVADGALTLVEATPVPSRQNQEGKQEPYRFNFRFQGGY